MRIEMMRRITLLLFLTIFIGGGKQGVHAANRATVAFQKLQSLAGNWEGKDEKGNAVKSNFKAMASKTTLLETLKVSSMEEMVTLYSVDGDSIALIHYCPTNNQPRMRAIPQPGDVKELVFSFQGAGNLPSLDVGHEHKLVVEFHGKDHIVERWTWREKGKDMEMIYHLARKNGN
jgi:hypothetical protein